MTIREKILLKLAQNPNYEGVDETEKSLVAELRAEMSAANAAAPTAVSAEIQAASKELVAQIGELVKSVSAQTAAAATPVNRDAVVDSQLSLTKEDVKAMPKEERLAKYVKALYQNDLVSVRALAEGVDADGGYLVPDSFRAELIEWLNRSVAIRTFCTVIPMTDKLLTIPRLSADVGVTWGTENRAISTTTADFDEVQLTPFRMNAIIYTSRELFDDSAISIMDILMRRFRDRVADEENKVFVNGSGTGRPKGINQYTHRAVNASNALTPDHITQAYWKLPEAYRATGRWLINSRTMEHLENKKDTQGAYLYPSLQGEVKTLKGRPVMVIDHMPSTKIIFGDFSGYLIGDRQQMSMETTTEAGDTWRKHQVGLKLVERVDGRLGLTQAFVQISNTGVN